MNIAQRLHELREGVIPTSTVFSVYGVYTEHDAIMSYFDAWLAESQQERSDSALDRVLFEKFLQTMNLHTYRSVSAAYGLTLKSFKDIVARRECVPGIIQSSDVMLESVRDALFKPFWHMGSPFHESEIRHFHDTCNKYFDIEVTPLLASCGNYALEYDVLTDMPIPHGDKVVWLNLGKPIFLRADVIARETFEANKALLKDFAPYED